MGRPKKEEKQEDNVLVTPNDTGWNDYVLNLLSDDEKIAGNPTTDGLRRIFEIALNCTIIESIANVIQCPSPENEKRATVTHQITFVLNDPDTDPLFKKRVTSGAADVYWGNCDKVYRNHPVAVAETRAEGRALRRGLKLRKVVAAEELTSSIDDNPDEFSVGKISNNQVNFIDQMSKRLNINVIKLLDSMEIKSNISDIAHDVAVSIIRELSKFQQNLDSIPENIKEYDASWRTT